MYKSLIRLIEYVPYKFRSEICTLGVLVQSQDNSYKIHFGNNLKKIKAIDPSCDVNFLRESLERISKQLTDSPELLELYQDGFGKLKIQKTEGYISYRNTEEYTNAIQWVLKTAVEPAVIYAKRDRLTTSRLYLEMKNIFNTYGWLAKPTQNLSDHRIVARFPLVLDEGLIVDFALKNGKMNCIQTIDYRHSTSTKKTEAQAKLLTLELSHQVYDSVNAYAVIAGSYEDDAKKSIKLAKRVVDDIFVHESSEDMTRLLSKLACAIGEEPLPILTID